MPATGTSPGRDKRGGGGLSACPTRMLLCPAHGTSETNANRAHCSVAHHLAPACHQRFVRTLSLARAPTSPAPLPSRTRYGRLAPVQQHSLGASAAPSCVVLHPGPPPAPPPRADSCHRCVPQPALMRARTRPAAAPAAGLGASHCDSYTMCCCSSLCTALISRRRADGPAEWPHCGGADCASSEARGG